MAEIKYTLLSDGRSDRALLPILSWLLREQRPDCAIQEEWADLYRLPRKPRGLARRIAHALDLYPCDILFVHRDAEAEAPRTRVLEITNATREIEEADAIPRAVPVVPVRMTEAWLLTDQAAIRKAVGNPNGRNPLHLPSLRSLERLPDPKQVLHQLLRDASGLSGRRLARLNPHAIASRVSQFTESFERLRSLRAFRFLEGDICQAIDRLQL